VPVHARVNATRSLDEDAHVAPEPSVTIRPMAPGDLDDVARLEAESFSMPWSAATFSSLLRRGAAELWVADLEQEGVVGYFILWCIDDQGELANIAVDERFRGRHIGSGLLDQALEVAKLKAVDSVYLEVRVSNEKAYAMYTSRGFAQVGVRKNYYDRPREDARVLLKELERTDES